MVITRRMEASRRSSPTKATEVVGSPAAKFRRTTGTTGAPASMAAWNIAGRNADGICPQPVPAHLAGDHWLLSSAANAAHRTAYIGNRHPPVPPTVVANPI
jgi:hypothetical protein